MVEQAAVNRKVGGSSPLSGAIKKSLLKEALFAGVAELADAQDLKSCGGYTPYRFDPGFRHHQSSVKSWALI